MSERIIAMTMRTAGLIAVMLVTALSVAFVAFAEEPTGWRVEIIPCVWITGIEGTVTVDGQEVEFEKSAGDLFDYVEFAAGLSAGAQYNRWVLRAQLDGFSLDTDNVDVEDRPEAGRLQSDVFLTEVAAGYQIGGWKEGQTFDLLVGLRALHVQNDLEEYGVGSFSKDSTLVDPLVGIRGSVPILPSKIRGLRFVGLAAIGGGGDSQLIYELQPQLEYQITDVFAARAGYRRVGWQLDIEDSDDEFDFSLAGLIFGVAISF